MSNVAPNPLVQRMMDQRTAAGLKIIALLPEGHEFEGSDAREFVAYAKDAEQLDAWKAAWDCDGVMYTVVGS